ncbi:hypothetical protein A7C99_0572 [Trichophyton rubrum]|uniref:Uncharacterized protein n=1 Tax=Trichophyton rubrum TaxID=5551 RepID=A0A178F7X5_TRIRU|nr:hypothetical protein A7C99_0572 [Trichophyton rubrum]
MMLRWSWWSRCYVVMVVKMADPGYIRDANKYQTDFSRLILHLVASSDETGFSAGPAVKQWCISDGLATTTAGLD